MQKTFLVIFLLLFNQFNAMDTSNLEEVIRAELESITSFNEQSLAGIYNNGVKFLNQENIYLALSLLITQRALPNFTKKINKLFEKIPGEQKAILKIVTTTITPKLLEKTKSDNLALFISKSRQNKDIQEIAHEEFSEAYEKSISPTVFRFLREENKQSLSASDLRN